MHKQIIATMAVRDLARSRAFFSALGYTFDPLLPNRTSMATLGSLRIWAASRRNKWQDGDGRKKTRIAAGFFFAAYFWRRGRESNPSKRLCRPLHNLFATSPEELLRLPSGTS